MAKVNIDKMTGKEIAEYLVKDNMNLPTLMICGDGYLLTYLNGSTYNIEQIEYSKDDHDKALFQFKIIEKKYRNKLETGWWE